MSFTLTVDAIKCTKCNKCVNVCPSMILQGAAGEIPAVNNLDGCIVCGHCAAVCPSGAINHEAFPKEKVHSITPGSLPTPEQTMLLIKSRRSNRAFSKKEVPADYLDLILEAAHRAPTASNKQNVSFTVVTDPEQLKAITGFTIGVFDKLVKLLTNPLVKPWLKRLMPDPYKYEDAFSNMKRENDNGNDLILRGAKAVIFIHTPESNRFGSEDANLAYQNGSLMAESLGVSQFYMGFVVTAIKQEGKGTLSKMLGMEGKVHAAMALGMPMFHYPNFIDKKEIEVNRQHQVNKR